jgi:hypothetical protein
MLLHGSDCLISFQCWGHRAIDIETSLTSGDMSHIVARPASNSPSNKVEARLRHFSRRAWKTESDGSHTNGKWPTRQHTPAIYAAICDLPSRGSSIKPEGSEPASNFELDQSKPASNAVLVEFAKFILARITQGKKIVLRLTAVEDEKEFSRLTNRVRLVLRQQG